MADVEIPKNDQPGCESVSEAQTQENGSGGMEIQSGPSASEPAQQDNWDHGTQMETGEGVSEPKEMIKVTLTFKGDKHQMEVDLNMSVLEFRNSVFDKTGVPPAMQKLMCKGPLRDGQSLKEARLSDNCKVMLVGSTVTDVMAANTKPTKEQLLKPDEKAAASKEPLSKQKVHTKVIDKGVPEDAMAGIKNAKESLPVQPLSGMRNKVNHKLRLTFKLELDQVWIGTPERTEKVPMSRISSIVSEPIVGHEEYHIMGMQMGTTEASRYWIYWVPAQFVDAIKAAILQ